MRDSKKDKVNVIFTLPCNAISTEEILGETAVVSYVFRMYYGVTKRPARFKQHSDLVEVKGYGMYVTRTLEFKNPLSSIVANRLQTQGYKVMDVLQIATLEKDFGYITAQNYEINHLMQKLSVSDSLADFNQLCLVIRKEITSWGDPVIDLEGRLVYDKEFHVVARDPFAKASRLALRKKLSLHRLNPLKTIKNALSDLSKGSNRDGGVDM